MINFKEFMINYKLYGLKEAFNNEIKKTITQEKEKIKNRKETRGQDRGYSERNREKEQGNGKKDQENN